MLGASLLIYEEKSLMCHLHRTDKRLRWAQTAGTIQMQNISSQEPYSVETPKNITPISHWNSQKLTNLYSACSVNALPPTQKDKLRKMGFPPSQQGDRCSILAQVMMQVHGEVCLPGHSPAHSAIITEVVRNEGMAAGRETGMVVCACLQPHESLLRTPHAQSMALCVG